MEGITTDFSNQNIVGLFDYKKYNILIHKQMLNLSNNQITEIKNIPNTTIAINLYNNQITEIKNLTKYIIWIGLPNNNISVIENIPESVKTLYLNNNQISVIENIPESIETLYLNNNRISTIGYIPESVVLINLKNNNISAITQRVRRYIIIDNPIFNGYSKKEISDFTQKYELYKLLSYYKISCVEQLVLSYLKFV